jgi:predicted AlkP superfamily phosphohydrolase/phosphomutase
VTIVAYIGPGAGFAFFGSLFAIIVSLIASALSLLIWPFRCLWLFFTRRGRFRKGGIRKAIFLGLDGLDPQLTERWMLEGKLPNLSRLREQGSYSRLRTTFPALSPVAWSTFATGVNPAKHNIFDFLNRNLRTYAPELSSARVHDPKDRRWFGLRKAKPWIEMRRKSETFWKILGKYAIESTILRVPITFPPERFTGRILSAMATPDLLGTQGTFSWFVSGSKEMPFEGGMKLPLFNQEEAFFGELPGPANTSISFSVRATSSADRWNLRIGGKEYPLQPGVYTSWIRLRFPTKPSATHGIVRFLLTAWQPELSIYASPVEIDPERPSLPISYPSYYAIYLAKLLGSFATLGMAEDTWALNEGAINEAGFLAQAKLIQAEREAMFFNALERTQSGTVACVFDTTDRVQHMFYRYLDGRCDDPNSSYAKTIEELYCDMDRLVGQVLPHVDERTALFVLSDHGFCSFRRGVNLNSWLKQEGYLALLHDEEASGDYFVGIDWARTRAYTFGLSGVYLNLEGRETGGIVPQGQAAALRAELKMKLTGLLDEEFGEIAILNAYDSHSIYEGPYREAAPDLVVGYAAGYRASWSAAVGKTTKSVFENNDKCWSGDHCVDPTLVPGVLFSNLKLRTEDPGIEDLAPTALTLFDVPVPKWMEGQSLFSSSGTV